MSACGDLRPKPDIWRLPRCTRRRLPEDGITTRSAALRLQTRADEAKVLGSFPTHNSSAQGAQPIAAQFQADWLEPAFKLISQEQCRPLPSGAGDEFVSIDGQGRQEQEHKDYDRLNKRLHIIEIEFA